MGPRWAKHGMYLARHALISAKPAAGQFDGTYGTVMDQQAVLTDSTADFWPRVPLQQPAGRSRAPLHRLTPGFRMRGTERNNDMISVANATRWNNSKCPSSRFVQYVNRIDQ